MVIAAVALHAADYAAGLLSKKPLSKKLLSKKMAEYLLMSEYICNFASVCNNQLCTIRHEKILSLPYSMEV